MPQSIKHFAVIGLLALTACSSSSTHNSTGHVLSDGSERKTITLTDGRRFTPAASPNSSCEMMNREVTRMDEIMGGADNFDAFLRRGDPELDFGRYYMSIAEPAILCKIKENS